MNRKILHQIQGVLVTVGRSDLAKEMVVKSNSTERERTVKNLESLGLKVRNKERFLTAMKGNPSQYGEVMEFIRNNFKREGSTNKWTSGGTNLIISRERKGFIVDVIG